ncbi:hypothetical protein HGRIS_002773 [Hohenbuehelia grisea]|uniref:Uncharacterized protein n=1 Tax=Hohenbuehelia grisea TaxID=104357 RepID=A0ABR3JMF6_9AGAR
MAEGPPPSDAGPSGPVVAEFSSTTSAVSTAPPIAGVTTYNPYAGTRAVQQPYYTYSQGNSAYYNYTPPNFSANWSAGTYPYASQYQVPQLQPHYRPTFNGTSTIVVPETQVQAVNHPPPQLRTMGKAKAKSPSPSPPPSNIHRHWDNAIRSFLKKMGLQQALHGFDLDMLVMNSDFERTAAPKAIDQLMKDLMSLRSVERPPSPAQSPSSIEDALDERKSEYSRLAFGEKARSQTSVIKDVSAFLAQNRARSDASNKEEFLLSLKKRRFNESGDGCEPELRPTCARTDAKTLDRDVQMKYDVAKNEDGPLRRTMKGHQSKPATVVHDASGTGNAVTLAVPVSTTHKQHYLDSENHPGLDERMKNIERHLAVRYVPSMPRDLLSRLRFLEDHIARLEKDYPPWAALHFNQPNRGWPPPPRSTPLIVPGHLRKANETRVDVPSTSVAAESVLDAPAPTKSRGKGSSLHRAALERLEMQQAMNEMQNPKPL